MKTDSENSLPKPPQLIRNKPSEDDEFAGGAHTRIARSVCSLIDSDESGLAIALVGKWGSGKSTVVSIIQKILNKGLPTSGNKNAVFNFDAWAHHGDPMRRALIEKLVRDLDAQKIIDEAEFKIDLARLRGDTVEVFRDIRTSISIWNLFFWLAALMVPLGYMLLNPSNWEKTVVLTSELFPSISRSFDVPDLGLILLFSPVVLGLIAWVAMRPSLAPWKKKFWTVDNITKKKPKYENENILTLLLNKGENKRLHEITRTQDPTTIQFNNLFDKIIQAVSQSNRRLVLVIDNIDRLPPDLAMETWATMRNFFSRGIDHERRSVLNCVSTVLTLSNESLKKILTDSNVTGSQEIAFDELSSDALGKTFDAVFYIPDAVATDWRAFLHDKLSVVLPGLGANELHDLYSIVDIYFSEKNSQPTPRRLVTFVNEVSILFHEWGDIVDVRSIGAYVLHRAEISDDLRPLQNGTLISPRMIVLMGDRDWQRDFAVVHLHLPAEKALQTILGLPMRFALENGEYENFAELWKAEGASLTLANVLQEASPTWSQEDPATFFTACDLLGRLEDVSAVPWRILGGSVTKIQQWGRIESDSHSGVASLLSNCPSYDVNRAAESVIGSLRTLPPPGGGTIVLANRLARILAEVSRCVGERSTPENARVLLARGTVPGDAGFYLDFAQASCLGAKFEFWQLGRDVQTDEIEALLQKQASQGAIGESLGKVIVGLISSEEEIDWAPIFESLLAYFRDTAEVSRDQALSYVEALATLSDRRRKLSTSENLNTASESGFLLRYFLNDELDWATDRLSARVVAATFTANPTASFPPPQGNPNPQQVQEGREHYQDLLTDPPNHKGLVDDVSRLIIEHLPFDELCVRADANVATSTLAAAIATRVVELEELERYNPDWILRNFGAAIAVIGDDNRDKLISELGGLRSPIAKKISKIDVTEIDPSFVIYLLNSDAKIKVVLANEISKFLGSLSDDDWARALEESESEILRLFSDFVESDYEFALSASAKRPLYAHFESILIGRESSNGDHFVLLIGSLPDGSRNSLFKDMASDIARSTESSAPGLNNLIDILGDDIFAALSTMSGHEGDVLRNVVCRLIQERNQSAIDLLVRNEMTIKRFVKKASKEDKAYFREVVADIHDDNEEWLSLREIFEKS